MFSRMNILNLRRPARVDGVQQESRAALTVAEFLRHKPDIDFQVYTNVSLKNSYIYFAVGKAANSSIKYLLQSIEYEGTRFKVKNVHNKHESPLLSPYQLKESHFIALLHDPQVIKFTFVRNPYSRLLSCYLDRIRKHNSIPRRDLLKLVKKPEDAEISFEEFIHAICDQEPYDMNPHWRVQSQDVCYDLVPFHFVGKVETLAQDLLRMGELVFGEPKEILDNSSINKSPRRTDAESRMREFYTPRLQQLVLGKYKSDFVTFSYPEELPPWVPAAGSEDSSNQTRSDYQKARLDLLRMLPKNSVGAEIGVDEGAFSKEIVRIVEPRRLHLIDPWLYFEDERYSDSKFGGQRGENQEKMDRKHEKISFLLDGQIQTGQVVVHRALSAEAAQEFPDEYFDWVYVDGNHLYEYVLADLQTYYRKIKPGGLLAGDDYVEGHWYDGGVKKAVDQFLSQSAAELLHLESTQFVLRKPGAC